MVSVDQVADDGGDGLLKSRLIGCPPRPFAGLSMAFIVLDLPGDIGDHCPSVFCERGTEGVEGPVIRSIRLLADLVGPYHVCLDLLGKLLWVPDPVCLQEPL